MKIAMMVRGYIPAPRPKDMIYAPVDLAVSICDGLAQRGHKVDYFGPIGTKLEFAKVQTTNLRALAENNAAFRQLLDSHEQISHYVPALWDYHMTNAMLEGAKKGKYDLVHFHHPEAVLPFADKYPSVPIIHTLHDPIYPWYREIFELYDSPNQSFVSISKNQRRDAPDLNYAATVHNGIDIAQFPYSDDPEDYLLIAGRVVPEKGFKEAIQIAKQTHHRLLIIGPVAPDAQGYFEQYIKPHLSDQILYLGYVEREQMWRYYQKAAAFLTPIQWEEPFGLTTIEAMACGTPVISLRRGAAPELIKHGKTGYLCDSISEMAACVKKLADIKREDCRNHVIAKFSNDVMIDAYEAVYEKILLEQPSVTRQLKAKIKHGAKKLRENLKTIDPS